MVTNRWAYLVRHGSPWVYMCSHWHQMLTQLLAQGHTAVIGGHPKIATFQPTHASLKMAKFSLLGPYREADWGYMEI